MSQKERKTSKSLVAVLVIAYVFLALFAGAFVFYAFSASRTVDVDINGGILAVLMYHVNNVIPLVTFKFEGANGIINLILSIIACVLAGIFVLFLIIGIIVAAKKKRAIVIPFIINALLAACAYIFVVTGFDKLYSAITCGAPFGVDILMLISSLLFVIFALAFIVVAYIGFFISLGEMSSNPGKAKEKAPVAEQERAPEAPVAEAAPVMFQVIQEEPAPVYHEEPKPEVKKAEEPVAEKEPVKEDNKTSEKEDLKALLREVIRDIVRDEIARNNANQPNGFNPMGGGTITGATFGGPLVVQYFNGGINSPQPAPAPQQEPAKEEPQPEPEPEPEPEPVPEEPVPEEPVEEVVEEPVPEEPVPEEPAEEPAPVEEVVEEPAPVEEPQPVVEPEPVPEEPAPSPVIVEPAPVAEEEKEEKKPIIRIPFTERMINADDEMKKNYNELKNEILSYGVNSRVSNSGDTFRLHRKTYVKITIAGLSLKLYFALNPDDYKDSTLPIQNAGHKGIYNEIPLVFKVKSGLSMRRCKELIQDLMDKNGLEQGEVRDIDWVEDLKNAAANAEDDEE